MTKVLHILLGPHWVYILPVLHLAGCVMTALKDFVWMPVILSEFPAGVFILVIAWRFGHPLFWFGIFGTLWWCWLSQVFFVYLRESD